MLRNRYKTYKDVIEELNSRLIMRNYKKKCKVHNLKYLKKYLDLINNNVFKYKIIHVAGTNGKGSVCSFLSNIFTKNNIKVGLFTSPHLILPNERIKINNNDITDEEFVNIFNFIDNIIKSNNLEIPTYFETIFLMAIRYFDINNVEYVILETGLGGICDATNSVNKKIISIITKISFDHQNYLGNTIKEITKEKAGIIKKNVPVVFLDNNKDATDIIINVANNNNSPFYFIKSEKYNYLHTYKEDSKNLVKLCIKVLSNIDKKIKNLKNINELIKNTYWPGRLEYINNFILDGAHNEDGIKSLLESIKLDSNFSVICLIKKNKNYNEILEQLVKFNWENVYFLDIKHNNFVEFIDCVELLNKWEKLTNNKAKIITKEELINILKNKKNNCNKYLITGSLYLIGIVKLILRDFYE